MKRHPITQLARQLAGLVLSLIVLLILLRLTGSEGWPLYLAAGLGAVTIALHLFAMVLIWWGERKVKQ